MRDVYIKFKFWPWYSILRPVKAILHLHCYLMITYPFPGIPAAVRQRGCLVIIQVCLCHECYLTRINYCTDWGVKFPGTSIYSFHVIPHISH